MWMQSQYFTGRWKSSEMPRKNVWCFVLQISAHECIKQVKYLVCNADTQCNRVSRCLSLAYGWNLRHGNWKTFYKVFLLRPNSRHRCSHQGLNQIITTIFSSGAYGYHSAIETCLRSELCVFEAMLKDTVTFPILQVLVSLLCVDVFSW